jgi:hypothetical protein
MLFDRFASLQRNFLHALSMMFIMLVLQSSMSFAKGPPKVKFPDGSFEYKEAGQEFSIRVPNNWIAEAGNGGLAVTLRPSAKAPRTKLPGGLIADPSITVAVVKKPVVMSEQSLESLAKEIEENFVRYNGSDTQFKIFQKNLIDDLPNGRKAFLYYVSFVTEGHDAGQAILVTGTDKVRYRVTLSDHRINFDKNLENFYPYMVSIDFKGEQLSKEPSASGPTAGLLYWVIAFLSAGVIVGLIARIRRKQEAGAPSDEIMTSSTVGSGRGSQLPPASEFNEKDSQYPQSEFKGAAALAASAVPKAESRADSAEYSMIPQSRIGFANSSGDGPAASEFTEPVFTEKDLSAPPQSVPLSQVVDETSAPPEMKKRWQILTTTKK